MVLKMNMFYTSEGDYYGHILKFFTTRRKTPFVIYEMGPELSCFFKI